MEKTQHTLRRLRAGSLVFFLVGLIAFAASFVVPTDATRNLLLVGAGSLVSLVVLLQLVAILSARAARKRLKTIMDFLENDSAPGFCTDGEGAVMAQNLSARDRFGDQSGKTMSRALEPLFANPDAVVHRLKTAALGRASAREDVVTRRGHVRVALHQVPGGLLWRLEDLVDRPPRTADGVGLPILTFGPSGTILYMNEILRGLIGRRVKRLRDVFESVPLRDGSLNRLMAKDGPQSVRTVLSAPINGRQELFVLPGSDVMEGQIDLDALPVAILRLDNNGKVVFANNLAQELLPACADTSETRFSAMVEGLGRSVREWISEAAAGRGLNRPETVRITGREAEQYLQVSLGRPLQDAEGGLLAVLNDATELKTMEAQFVQSQKMQAIGQLAGGVAHDFNNLLTAISGHCDLMLLRHAEGDEDYADLMQITQNANRAAALVGQLLAFSRKQTLEMKTLDLRDTLGDLAHLLNRLVGDRVTLRLEHDPALLPIRGDRRQLEQVLMNLVVNARDAMADGGEILIETQCKYMDEAVSRDHVTMPSGQYVVVNVFDQGAGISNDNLSRIFEPFFTTKRPGEGTGLGLSMAYGIIKQSGGYIFAESTLGQGSCFSLYFPALVGAEDRVDVMSQLAHAATIDAVINVSGTPDEAPPPILPGEATDDMAADLDEVHEADLESEPEQGPPENFELEVPDISGADSLEFVSNDAENLLETSDQISEQAETTLFEPDAAGDPADVEQEAVGAGFNKRSRTGGSAEEADRLIAFVRAQVEPEHLEEDLSELAEESASAPAMPPKDIDAKTRPVVLLVEDEAPVPGFASRALRLRGYDVVEADCAESALDRLEDDGLLVDLFVTDVMMPGLDGPSWVRQAMKARPDVRTVFMSGYTQDALSENSVPIPNSMFLAKPFSLTDLTTTVERALS